MRFQVGQLSKLPDAAIKWAHKRLVSGMNSAMSAQIEIKGKAFSTAFKGTLVGLLSSVNQLMTFQLRILSKSFATF